MNRLIVDSCVLVDLFTDDPTYGSWAAHTLNEYRHQKLCINPIIFSEISLCFDDIEPLLTMLNSVDITIEDIPLHALFRASRVQFSTGLNKQSLFLVGAHAQVVNTSIITRDVKPFRLYFPDVNLISPK